MIKVLRIALVVLGAALALYSAWCIAFLPYGIGNYLPGAAGLAMFGAGLGLPWILGYTASGRRRSARLVITYLAAFGVLSFAVMLAGVWLNARGVPENGHDAVIVLGAALAGDVIPQGFQNRLDTALGYLADNENAVVVVSGGQGTTETVTAASAMRRYLVENGIEPGRIIEEDRATSTFENFVFSRELLDEHFGGEAYTVVYVTNDFHLLRARVLAWKVGVPGEGLAAPSQWFMLPNYYSREFLAMIRALITVVLG
ncbi:MAG: YdcF family protein [Defluviitaleaceae bacterium]|nr:YdcF family protein [Defluviitaleaceae bacterium]